MITRSTASDLATTNTLISVAPDDRLREAARLLFEGAVGTAVVIDGGRPIGMFSERDLAAAVARDADLDREPVRSWMSSYLISARPDDRLVDLAAQMIDGEVRHVPVVDEGGTLVGVVSLRDVVRPLLVEALTP